VVNVENTRKTKESTENIKVVFSSRLLSLLADNIYSDKLTFVRELIQNSLDAYGNNPEKKIEIEISENQIEIMDYACGMSYEFLKSDFKRIGHQFKHGNSIGFYGIGRLSIWKVKPTKVELFTKTENEKKASYLIWKDLGQYTLSKVTLPCPTSFTKYRITVNHPFSIYEIKDYITRNMKNDVVITLRDTVLNRVEMFNPKEEFNKRVLYSHETSEYVFYVLSSTWYTKIYSKGILAKTIYSFDNFAIDFKENITTLSRDNILVSFDKIKEILEKEVKEILLNDEKLMGLRTIILEFLGKCGNVNLKLLYPITKDLRIKDIKPPYVLVPNDVNDVILEKIKAKGFYPVLCTTKEYEVFAKYCNSLDAIFNQLIETKGKDISHKFEQSIRNLEDMEIRIKKIVERLKKNMPSRALDFESINRMIERAKDSTHKELKVLAKLKLIRDGFISVVELEDSNVVAYADAVNDKVVLNYANSFVKMCLDHNREDLLLSTLVHEMVHLLGYSEHNQDFNAVYTTILHEFYKEMIQNQIVFESRMSPHKVGAKGKRYVQHRVNVPREVSKLLGNKKAKVRVTLEILETE